MAITLKISAHRLNMADYSPSPYHTASSQAFSSHVSGVTVTPMRQAHSQARRRLSRSNRGEANHDQSSRGFGNAFDDDVGRVCRRRAKAGRAEERMFHC
jgi:hypothetical protein